MPLNDLASRPERWAVAVGVCALTFSLFHSTLGDLLHTYGAQRTYSHGLLVMPAALCLIWLRRPFRAGTPAQITPALLLLLGSVALHASGTYFYISFLCSCGLLVWLLGLILLWGGPSFIQRALPAWGFLIFAIPLPHSVESQVLLPLQGIATKLSCCILIISGQPAFAQGTQIQVLDQPVTVAAACSGLSLMLSTIALSYFYGFAVERSMLQRFVLLVSAVPIAITVNSVRIAVACCVYSGGMGGQAHLVHDVLGWLAVPLAVLPLASLSIAIFHLQNSAPITACH